MKIPNCYKVEHGSIYTFIRKNDTPYLVFRSGQYWKPDPMYIG